MIENGLKLTADQFNYNLPDDYIAKYPLQERDSSKLLFYDKGAVYDKMFKDLPSLVGNKSFVVCNNTTVVRARIEMYKETGARIEVFCLEPYQPYEYQLNLSSTQMCRWHCMIGNAKKWKTGNLRRVLWVGGKEITISLTRESDSIVLFKWDNPDVTFGEILDFFGELPIPPYLNRKTEPLDLDRYQTIFSKNKGSVAAPTAGLHFTDSVKQEMIERGILFGEVTLHVGAGTFKPLADGNVADHLMHAERFTVSLPFLYQLKEHLGEVVAVGTTSVRTLESLYHIGNSLAHGNSPLLVTQWQAYDNRSFCSSQEALCILIDYMEKKQMTEFTASTQIMIVPGYSFRMVDKLVTNFHQPQSTLLLLVSAFVGSNWKEIYTFALENRYRFLSYGDSSLLCP